MPKFVCDSLYPYLPRIIKRLIFNLFRYADTYLRIHVSSAIHTPLRIRILLSADTDISCHTVSYTHLPADIAFDGLAVGREGEEELVEAPHVFAGFDGTVPVSYTHLDVYKRQPETMNEQITAIAALLLEINGKEKYTAFFDFSGHVHLSLIHIFTLLSGLRISTSAGFFIEQAMNDVGYVFIGNHFRR